MEFLRGGRGRALVESRELKKKERFVISGVRQKKRQ